MRQAQAPQKKSPSRTPALRIEPEKRLCPAFDPVSIATFPVAEPEEMGYRVLDNFCEEHIQYTEEPCPGAAWLRLFCQEVLFVMGAESWYNGCKDSRWISRHGGRVTSQ